MDIGLLFTVPPEPTLLGQPFDIEADLAPADLVHRVLAQGRLVFETDRSARVRFEVKKQNEYFDMLPVWRLYSKGRREAAT